MRFIAKNMLHLIASGNPFVTAYLQSDWFGKGIFWGLFALSAVSWTLLIHKSWIYYHVRRLSKELSAQFSEKDPLNLPYIPSAKASFADVPHPFFEIYKALKQKTLQIIGRNHFFSPDPSTPVFLSEADLGLIQTHADMQLAAQAKRLEKNVYILSTVAALGPFLGLLGTVWGILLTFSELNSRGAMASGNSAMLAGLSMALATTVIGLLIAIPALVGYNYFKNAAREYRREMEDFSHLLLTAVELQYRKPEDAQKIPTLQ